VSNGPANTTTRRSFLRRLGQIGALGGLVSLVGLLHGRDRRGQGKPLLPRQRCVNTGVCSSCGRADACLLPQADAYRHGLKQKQESRHG
jgi:hypothetical protein